MDKETLSQIKRAAGKGGARIRAKDAWGEKCSERDKYAVIEKIARAGCGIYWLLSTADLSAFFENYPEARTMATAQEIKEALQAARKTVADLEAQQPLPPHERRHLGQARRQVTVLEKMQPDKEA